MAQRNQTREFRLNQGVGGALALGEGNCLHCNTFVTFKAPARSSITYYEDENHDDGHSWSKTHIFVVGYCPRPSCRKPTVVRQLVAESHWRGNPESEQIVEEGIVYPVVPSSRELPDGVPDALKRMYDEAAAIEYLSPNATGFLAGRILEQALRDRVAAQRPSVASGSTPDRRRRLVDLIGEFAEQEPLTQEFHQNMELLREFRNIAAHPDRDESGDWVSIDQAEATFLLDVAADILDFVYVRPGRQRAMRIRLESKKQGPPAGPTPRPKGLPTVVPGVDELPDDSAISDDDIPF